MNRRNFLKSIATVCGAAVVCPGELLKGKTVAGIDCGKPKFRWIHVYIDGGRLIHRTIIFDESALVAEFEKEFWNTEFKSPLIIGAYDETIQTTY